MLIIIHGWSDTSASFKKLGQLLKDEKVAAAVSHVYLGDYVSLDDDVTYDDITAALDQAWEDQNLPTKHRSCDVLVHSTGGLVIRHWMVNRRVDKDDPKKKADPSQNPIHRLVMLAPANFGSHLAHKGRSFIGRAVKGFKSERRFHTGARILDGLELASDFTWNLAMQDRFGSKTWYGPGGVLCTVLVGTAGFRGISAVANEAGSDGTVRVSTANLDPLLVTLDFASNPQAPEMKSTSPKGRTAFARLPGVDHGSITLKSQNKKDRDTNQQILDLIKKSLRVTDNSFEEHIKDLNIISDRARADGSTDRYTQAYQNTVVRLTDNFDDPVLDYFFELFAKKNFKPDGSEGVLDHKITELVQGQIFGKVHNFKRNPAYRSILFNISMLQSAIIEPELPLFVSVSAMPDIRQTKTVGYSTIGYDDIGSIKLDMATIKKLFQPDRTVLIDMTIRREQTDRVFRFSDF